MLSFSNHMLYTLHIHLIQTFSRVAMKKHFSRSMPFYIWKMKYGDRLINNFNNVSTKIKKSSTFSFTIHGYKKFKITKKKKKVLTVIKASL